MQGVVHGLVNRVLHRGNHRGRPGILIGDQVIEHRQLGTLAHFLGTPDTSLGTVALDDEHLAIGVLELPANVREPDLRDVLLQEVGVVPAELQVLAHVLDTVLDRVRHIQRQVNPPKTRDLPIRGDVQEQVFPHHRGLGNASVTEVDHTLATLGKGVEHAVVNQRSLVLLTLLAIDQLDERHELQSKVAGDVAWVNVVTGVVEVVLNLPRCECFCDWIKRH